VYHHQVLVKSTLRLIFVLVLLAGASDSVFADEGQADGVTGLQLKPGKGRVLLVTNTLPGTPAALVGIRKGDKIIAISDKPLKSMSLKAAVKMLRGAPGTKVHLTIKRGDAEPFDIIIKRAKPKAAKPTKPKAAKPAKQAKTSSVATTTVTATASTAK
jgi:C-terminal processing protease CtpA/Prc